MSKKTIDFWKKGSVEVFSYICILPAVFMLMVMVVGMVQLGTLKEKMEYTTYVACRAAAASETKAKAKINAQEVAEENLKGLTNSYEDGSLKVNIKCISGKIGKSTSKWEKGNYVQCDLTVNATTITPFIKGKKTYSIVMAIEVSE